MHKQFLVLISINSKLCSDIFYVLGLTVTIETISIGFLFLSIPAIFRVNKYQIEIGRLQSAIISIQTSINLFNLTNLYVSIETEEDGKNENIK